MKGIYLITQERWHADPGSLAHLVEQALLGGACMVQFRDKHSTDSHKREAALVVQSVCRKYRRPFIINDDIGLAKDITADGVHLGAADEALAIARRELGPDAIIGISCYGDINLAHLAQEGGASYVAFGSFHASSTKPEAPVIPVNLLCEARARLRLPVCAIGGIMADNAQPLIDAGADLLAVISAISDSADPKAETEKLHQLFVLQTEPT